MTISNSMKDEIVSFFGGDGAKVFVTHLGQEFRPCGHLPQLDLKDRFGISQQYLLFVGFPNHRKNLPGLIRAFALALRRLSETYDLVICGDIHTKIESEYAAILKTIAETGMKDRVKFIGYLENEELQSLMAGARAFVFPSFYEGFGLPVVEAMACGTPVLVSDIPVLREIAGEAAVYVDPHDDGDIASGICRLLSDERLGADLRVRGSAQAADFTWKETARKTLECYCRVGGGSRE
jgi:glycosyltransferase involved in cell wall biosynthesis